MKFKHPGKILTLIIVGLWLNPAISYAVSADFVKLLDNIIQMQPEQQITKGLQELHSTNQSFSNSWTAGDVDLIVHHENDTLTGDEDYQNWQVGVEFPVWLPSQKNAQKLVASSYGQEVSAQQIFLRWLASDTLRKLAWSYQSARVEVAAARSALEKSRSLEQKVKLKVDAGESPELDLLLARKVVLKQQHQLVLKQSAMSIAQNQFRKWTQVSQLPEDIQERPKALLPLEQHPKIVRLMSTLQISQAQLQKMKSFKQESPRLFFGAQNDKDKNTENTSLMFEVSIPLGVNPGYSPKLAEEKRNVYEKQAVLDKAKIQLEQDVFKARQILASSKQGIHFSKHQYELSKKALKMSEQAYQLGETNIQNLLLVQQQTAEAKLNYQLAQALSGQATANLNQISGHILGAKQ